MKRDYLKHLMVLLVTSFTSLSANAYSAYIDGIYYNLDAKTQQAEVTYGNNKYEGELNIPSTIAYKGETYDVTTIGNDAFSDCSSLTSVTIPSSVTSIGDGAFRNCSRLTSVTISSSVTSIGEDAFYGCSGLTSVTIPSSVTSIGASAFSDCSSLTSVTISEGVTSIGNSAFSSCSSLTSINIPSSVTSIGNSAFGYCSSLTSINIPSSVTTIGKRAFYKCNSLTSITIASGVTTIGESAFEECRSLTSFNIPSSVTSIGDNAFYYCFGLTSVTIPESVMTIGKSAFYYCWGLTSVTIPESVTSIGNFAFGYCSSLTSVTIPSGVTYIGGGAFYKCTGLRSVTIGNSVANIGSDAFYECTIKQIFCHAITPPALMNSISTEVLYVPHASVEKYKSADYWKNTKIILSIEEYESAPLFTHPSLLRSDLLFYDNDGDGIMEMLGQYWERINNRWKYGYAIMNDDERLMSFMDFRERDDLKIANGKGDICLGNRIWTGNSWYDATQNCQSSPYMYYTSADLDNDGKIDMISTDNELTVLTSQPDTRFYEKSVIPVVEDSAYIAYTKSMEPKSSSLGSGMSVVSGYVPSFMSSGISRTVDINGDGWLDLLSSDGKSAYMSLAGNGYYKALFTGEIYPYDLDGNGTLDYLLYDGNSVYTVITDAHGQSVQKRVFDNKNVKKYICRDFDHDGDVDVLVYVTDNSYTYFIFMRNDGNGTFKKKEEYLEGIFTFRDCRDYDADGQYEVLLWNYNKNKGWQTPAHKIVKVKPDFTLTDVSENFSGYPPANSLRIYMGDYDNDGYTDMKLTNKYRPTSEPSASSTGEYMTGHYSKQTRQNGAPQKMTPPTMAIDEKTGYLRIIWQRSEDAETSSCDLTYEVRIGTAPGRSDVLCPFSLPDGRRRVVADGSMGTQLQTLFNINAYPAGKYYVAVQAIDAGGLGGAWSDETIYEHHAPIPVITASTLNTSTADTITVMANLYDEGAEYHWMVTNGKVISQEKNRAQIAFLASGAQQVMLTCKYSDAEYHSNSISIDVNAFKLQTGSNGIIKYMPSVFFDINQDGYPDGISSYFIINDGKGNFKKYPKSFNSDLNIGNSVVLDLNRDGFPDVLSGNGAYINDEEGEFDNNPELINNSYAPQRTWIDFNNTGYYSCINSGDLKTTSNYKEYSTIMSLPYKDFTIFDINRDGFMDIVCEYWKSNHYCISAYINKGDESFRQMDMLELEKEDCHDLVIADLNNDGYMDIITTGGYSYSPSLGSSPRSIYKPLRIYLGQPNYTFTFAFEINCDNDGIKCVQDLDNNGYLDVTVSTANSGGYRYSNIYFYQNMQYEIVKSGDTHSDNPFIVIDGNGYPQSNSYRAASAIKNESPKTPSMVMAKQTEDGMVINWADAEDDHTPAVQMRYNVSVKRKGKTGEGSYLISPMNGGSSKAALVFPYYYKQSTTMTVPASALTAGETYEVQVQAIDLWNQWSPMTEPVEITITAEDGSIEAPDVACVGRETLIKHFGLLYWNSTIDFGKDSKYKENGGSYIVTWNSEGVKDITMGNLHSQILVKKPIDVSFNLPDEIFTGAELPIFVTKEMEAQVGKAEFRITSAPDGATCNITYSPGTSEARFITNRAGTYELEAVCNDALFGNSYKVRFNVKEAPKAEISRVDAESSHYIIRWSSDGLPRGINKAILLKEGFSTNQFSVLDTVDVTNDAYTDLTSSPQTMSARYKMVLLTDGNQRYESAIHKPLHMMIGKSAQGGYNLMWNAYEGMTVDNYRIWRGRTSDELQLVAQVAGSQQSYTDTEAPDGDICYAVSFTPVRKSSSQGERRAPAVGEDIVSNVVSTRSAAYIIQANSLSVITTESSPCLTDEKPTLQLYPLLLPTYCTFDKVAWSIIEGADLATISSNGILTGTGGQGTVTVRASSLDGSNLTADISIPTTVTNNPNGIITIRETTDVTVVGHCLFSLDGKKMTERPARGIYIEAELLSDGTIRTKKISAK